MKLAKFIKKLQDIQDKVGDNAEVEKYNGDYDSHSPLSEDCLEIHQGKGLKSESSIWIK